MDYKPGVFIICWTSWKLQCQKYSQCARIWDRTVRNYYVLPTYTVKMRRVVMIDTKVHTPAHINHRHYHRKCVTNCGDTKTHMLGDIPSLLSKFCSRTMIMLRCTNRSKFSTATIIKIVWRNCDNTTVYMLGDTVIITIVKLVWRNCDDTTVYMLGHIIIITIIKIVWRNCDDTTVYMLGHVIIITIIKIVWCNCDDTTVYMLGHVIIVTIIKIVWRNCDDTTVYMLGHVIIITIIRIVLRNCDADSLVSKLWFQTSLQGTRKSLIFAIPLNALAVGVLSLNRSRTRFWHEYRRYRSGCLLLRSLH